MPCLGSKQIGSIEVRHEPRRAGQSTYTLRRLIRLWLAAWVNFSVLPLRVATVLGLAMGGAGLVALVMATLLAISTLTTKQHFVADVVAGYTLAFLGRGFALSSIGAKRLPK